MALLDQLQAKFGSEIGRQRLDDIEEQCQTWGLTAGEIEHVRQVLSYGIDIAGGREYLQEVGRSRRDEEDALRQALTRFRVWFTDDGKWQPRFEADAEVLRRIDHLLHSLDESRKLTRLLWENGKLEAGQPKKPEVQTTHTLLAAIPLTHSTLGRTRREELMRQAGIIGAHEDNQP